MAEQATAEACANIAFIKYWGNRPEGGNLPLNPSVSMTLASCVTRTTVELAGDASVDEVALGGRAAEGRARERVVDFLGAVRDMAGRGECLRVQSSNSFPTGCGIASSASGFAALAAAACSVYGLAPGAPELSRVARLGSGSAARSVMDGFAALRAGRTHEEAYAEQVAAASHWPEIRDVIVVATGEEKEVSSAEGHGLARTSEMLAGRLAAVPERFDRVLRAIEGRDLAALGEAAEADALSMHAVMLTSRPALLYWRPATVDVMRCVWELRERGVQAYFTIDAGPNVHILTLEGQVAAVEGEIRERFGFRTISDRAGPGARIVEGG